MLVVFQSFGRVYCRVMNKIVQQEHPVLHQIAEPVSSADFGSPKLLEIIERMKKALAGEADGVALAAPQIGVPLRIFIVAGFVFKKDEATTTPPDRVFINPEIISVSKQKRWMDEGCLSVRRLYGETHRSTKAKVRAYDEHGNKFELGGSGLLAQIFQHETDHLNGVLFIDHAREIREISEEEHDENLREMEERRKEYRKE